MARPRTPVGTFGEINFRPLSNGKIEAYTRYRDEDGILRPVKARGATKKAAEHCLKEKVRKRGDYQPGFGELTPDSSFAKLVEVWLEDIELEDRLAANTRRLYEWNMEHLVKPAFENFTLRECTVGRVDRFLKSLAKNKSHSAAQQAKKVMSLAFGLAVRYEAMGKNPVRGVARLQSKDKQVKALTLEDLAKIRAAVKGWRRDDGLPGPKPDGQLEAIIEVMLGTSCRIGEVLALRKCDVEVTEVPALVRIRGTVVTVKGRGTYRQEQPKSSSSVRTVAVPSFTAEVLRQRLVKVAGERSDHLLFFSRNGTPLTTANVRRRLREALKEAGIEGVTPHAFRRTVATELERAAGADLAAEMLGHTSAEITRKHYIEKNDVVNAATAEILESLAPRAKPPADTAAVADE